MKFPPRLYVATVVTVALLAFFGVPQAAGADEQESYFQLDVLLETHAGEQMHLADLAGAPTIVTMFYGSCPHVCPMLISTMQEIRKQLSSAARERFRVAMFSVDPERDTPEALHRLAAERGLDPEQWILARTANSADTRPLAAVLGVKYKALPDGNFNHTSVMILLDSQGREIARSTRLGVPDSEFVQRAENAFR